MIASMFGRVQVISFIIYTFYEMVYVPSYFIYIYLGVVGRDGGEMPCKPYFTFQNECKNGLNRICNKWMIFSLKFASRKV